MPKAIDKNLGLSLPRLRIGHASHPGNVRLLNEDCLLQMELRLGQGPQDTGFALHAVADGIGGLERGEIASALALKILAQCITSAFLSSELQNDHNALGQDFAPQVLTDAVKAANAEIFDRVQAMRSPMGTTLAAALIVGNRAHIANVGDSRVYLSDAARIRQITTDHSVVAALVAAGEITPEEIHTHPQRNIITRCLGIHNKLDVDLFVEELKPDTSLILCSDGLWETVGDNEIAETVVNAGDPQLACEELVRYATHNGGRDNISVIVINVQK